jgi:hypothetical protein
LVSSGLSGYAYGGNQAIGGATIQVYAVGTTGDGSAAMPLLTTLTTTSDGTGVGGNATNGNNSLPVGSFKVVDTNYCPADATHAVYLTATGGNPGVTPAVNNSAIVMLAMLGPCNGITSSTHVLLNELTTVGSVAPLAPYIKGPTLIGYDGSASGDGTAFQAAVNLVQQYTATATGTVPGPNLPSGYYASSTEIDTLADVMASCVNSKGDSSSLCPQVFADSTTGSSTPTDILTATANIVNNPTSKVTQIAGLAPTNGPFQPVLSSPPTTWALPILPQVPTPTISLASGNYTGGQFLSIMDTSQNVNIYFTTDGTTPTANSSNIADYGGLYITTAQTVKAIAVSTVAGYANSNVASATYTFNTPAATPTFSPTAGTYSSVQNVKIQSVTGGASLYYTTDGTAPTTSSAQYVGTAVAVTKSGVLRAIAVAPGYAQSSIGTAIYTLQAASPTYSVSGFTSLTAGVYAGTGTLTLSDSTTGTTIYYTTDGTTPTTASTKYVTPIAITTSQTVKSIAVATGYSNSVVGSATYTLQAATPTFSAGTGTYSTAQAVTISCSSPGVTIYYTTDGTTPTTASAVYSAAVPITTTGMVLYAVASGNGFTTSNPFGAQYTLTAATPVATPSAGSYGTAQTVTLSSATPGTTIRYTLDGTTPVGSSPVYSGAIALPTTATLKANASLTGFNTSGTLTAAYTIGAPAAAAPVLSTASTTYAISPTVTMSTTTPGATIYYTTDGSTPNLSSTVYTGPLNVSSEVVKAFAAGGGYSASAVTSATYQVVYANAAYSGPAVSNVVAGSGTNGAPLASTQATAASFLGTNGGVAVDGNGNTYVIAEYNAFSMTNVNAPVVYKVTPQGQISVYASAGLPTAPAGNGVSYTPGLAIDGSGNLYLTGSARIVKIDTSGNVTTVAGIGSSYLSSNLTLPNGDGGAAVSARVVPTGPITLDSSGNIYFVDNLNSVRKIAGGTITTVAGVIVNSGGLVNCSSGGYDCFGGDGGPAVKAAFNNITGLAVDASGNLYLNDSGNERLRKLTTDGKVNTIAGTGAATAPGAGTGNGGLAISASFYSLNGVVLDANGNIYVTDGPTLRVIDSTGTIRQIVLNADGDPAPSLSGYLALIRPAAMTIDAAGDLYISDAGSNQVHEVTFAAASAAGAVTASPGTGLYSGTQSVTLTTTTPNATIYYTAYADTSAVPTTTLIPYVFPPATPDGPNTVKVYTGPISAPFGTIIKARAYAVGYTYGPLMVSSYSVASTPEFTPVGGNYPNGFSIGITCATPGATIYWSGSASAPVMQYTGPIPISVGDVTPYSITAICAAPGYANSEVGTSPSYTSHP